MDQHKLNEVNELMARNQVEGPDDPVSGESTEDRAETAESTVVNEAKAMNAPTPKPPVQAQNVIEDERIECTEVCTAWCGRLRTRSCRASHATAAE